MRSAADPPTCLQIGQQTRSFRYFDGQIPNGRRLVATMSNMTASLWTIPILDGNGNPIGALEVQRNVTDEAMVQVKYQEMLDSEARERERLAQQIRARTKELLETNQTLLKVQRELLAYKKGLML